MFEPVPLNKPEWNNDNLMAYLVYQSILCIPIKYSFYFEQYCKIKNIEEAELRKELGISSTEYDKSFSFVSNKHFYNDFFTKEPAKPLFYSSIITYGQMLPIVKEVNEHITGLLKTNNYNQFTGFDISDPRTNTNKKAIESFKESLNRIKEIQGINLLKFDPIGVNSKLEIIAGEYKFIAAKELKIDIFYVILDDFLIDKLKSFFEIGHYYGLGIGSTPGFFKGVIRSNSNKRLIWDSDKLDQRNNDYHGFDQDAIDSAFEGDPENCWNVD